MQIALKEANETGYWLELLFKTDYITENEYKALNCACTSIRVMLIFFRKYGEKSEFGDKIMKDVDVVREYYDSGAEVEWERPKYFAYSSHLVYIGKIKQ